MARRRPGTSTPLRVAHPAESDHPTGRARIGPVPSSPIAALLFSLLRSQGHSGPADWSWIPKIKARVSIPIFVNGDVNSPESALRAFNETGCDGVMIARAAISNPFIFREVKEFFATGSYSPASLNERVELCLGHLRHSLALHSEKYGIPAFRKYYLGYFKGIFGAAKLRAELMTMDTYAQVEERLYRFAESFEEVLVLNS